MFSLYQQKRASDAQSNKTSEDKATRALRGVDKKLLTPAKMLVPSKSKSSTEASDEVIRNIRAEGSKIRSTMVAELRTTTSSATAPSTSRESRSRTASEDRASAPGSSSMVPEGRKKRGRPPKTDIQDQESCDLHLERMAYRRRSCFFSVTQS